MSEQTERERAIVFNKGLENIRQILQSNSERVIEIQEDEHPSDEVANKRARNSSTGILPNQHALLDYLVKPDLKKIANRKMKFEREEMSLASIQSPFRI